MKQLAFRLILLSAILVLGSNCKKGNNGVDTTPVETTFSISGRVTDANNAPVSNASVKIGTSTATSDVNGNFTINNVTALKDAALVKIEKQGYFKGLRTFVASPGIMNYVNISLLEKKIAGNFSATAGGTVTVPGGSISFQQNSIVSEGGAPYTGTVSVASAFIDPTAANYMSIMPGDLRGINSNNDVRLLESFGMMGVQLTGSSGQALQIATGKTATIDLTIPAALLSRAPATIPLWYFDEEKGFWKEEGSAVKTANKYVGTVTHFSFWNWDVPFAKVELEALIKDQNGNAVQNIEVKIQRAGNSGAASSRTDSQGHVRGFIPANEPLTLLVIDKCGSILQTQNIGPYSSNVNLGTITLNFSSSLSVNIAGTAVNCNNTPIVNGYANVLLEGVIYRANINSGQFSVNIIRCSGAAAVAQLTVTDLDNVQQSVVKNLNVTTGNVNAGQLQACGQTVSEFISYTISTNPAYVISVPPDSIRVTVGSNTAISAWYGAQRQKSFSLVIVGNTVGTHYVLNGSIDNNVYAIIVPSQINLTEFGPPATGYIAGTFTGQVTTGQQFLPVSLNFRVKRP